MTQPKSDCILLFNTCPDESVGSNIAKRLVDKRLAACVNILPGIRSVYRWQGKVTSEQETLLVIKSTVDQLTAIQALILEHHPYELPEIVSVPISAGLDDYLSWIRDNVEG